MNKKLVSLALFAIMNAHIAHGQIMCNPMNLPYRYSLDGGYREAADPTLVNFKGVYYLFASKCGAYYRSKDLLTWEPITSNLPIEGYAPTVEEMDEKLYFTHSLGTSKIYVTDDPDSGEWTAVEGGGTKAGLADPMLLHAGSKMYLYWGSSGDPNSFLCGQELSAKTLKPLGTESKLISCHKDRYGWEVPGDYNERKTANPWLEGVWVTPYNNRYYLQYSAPGTEMKSYSNSVYVSDSPLGPYKVQEHNPFCYRPEGYIAAAGHGSTFQDNYGNWWHITTGTISKRHMFERRLVLYPVFFDADGQMWAYTGFGDWPIKMPQKKISSPEELSTGWQLLSYNKPVKASSSDQSETYAVDENIRTWWSANNCSKGAWIQVDLEDKCDINAVQVNFADEGSLLKGEPKYVYQYKVEISDDGTNWVTVCDKSSNTANAPHDLIVFDNTLKAQYVRVYNMKNVTGKFSISGLRVFGKNGNISEPAQARLTSVQRDDDRRSVRLAWHKADGSAGYNVRYGYAPDKLYLNYEVLGEDDCSLTINSLNTDEEYYFTIDAWNEAGTTKGTDITSTKEDYNTDTEQQAKTFQNPVIYADCPDPDVCRVGDTFYMVSTTMHMSPGCTIMKSKDLVNWSVCGYAHDQLEESDNFALKNGQNDYAAGSWAANIRYDKYEGLFYVIVTCNTTGKSYIFTTKNIEKGMWKRYVVDKCYDPGFLFEDTGTECKKWVVYPSDDLQQHMSYKREMHTNGGQTVELGQPEIIIDYANLENPAEGLRAEGYHGYKVGDYYYIFMIQGVGAQRQEIVWRSKTMEPGSFEGKRVFAGNIKDTNGNDYMPFTGVAQGGIVDTPDGQWYSMLFEDYGAVGRIPVLVPMTWSKDGWPVLGNGGKSVNRYNPMPVTGVSAEDNQSSGFGITVSDEFDNQPARYQISENESVKPEYWYRGSNLKLNWQWNHNPDNRNWTLLEREGWLRLKTVTTVNNIREARNTLTQRTFGPKSSAATHIDVSGLKNGDYTGIASFQNQYGFVGVTQENGTKYIVMRRAQQAGDADGKEMARVELRQNEVWLKVACDFTDKKDEASFYYSTDGMSWMKIGDNLKMAFDWPDFVGQRFALFYYSTKRAGGHSDFDWFRVSEKLDDTFTATDIHDADASAGRNNNTAYDLGGRILTKACTKTSHGISISGNKKYLRNLSLTDEHAHWSLSRHP